MASPRSLSASLSLLQALQARGLAWMAGVTTREQVRDAMAAHLTAMRLSPSDMPPVLHVAGTKGKGSTAAFAEAMLRARGFRTGLFTSPHLVSPVERFRVDGAPVTEDTFLAHFWRTWDAVGGGGVGAPPPPLPGFTLLTLLALALFTEARVDIMVLEVGVGGRLDATNALPRGRILASAVTTLDFDHVEVLGHTLPAIANQKAGIFRRGVPAVCAPARADAAKELLRTAREVGTPLWRATSAAALCARCPRGEVPPLSLAGSFQATNAAVAVSLIDLGLQRAVAEGGGDIWPPWNSTARALAASAAVEMGIVGTTLRDAVEERESGGGGGGEEEEAPLFRRHHPLPPWVLQGLATAVWPGRAQVIDFDCRALLGGPLTPHPIRLYLDGAHTGRSMTEVAAWFAGETRGGGGGGGGVGRGAQCALVPPRLRRVLIFYCGSDKDVLGLMLPLSCAVPWDAVYIVGVTWALTPRRSAPQSVGEAMAQFVKRRQAMEDEEALVDVAAGEALEAAGVGGGGGGGQGAVGVPVVPGGVIAAAAASPPPITSLAWLSLLASLWTAVLQRPAYEPLRKRAAGALAGLPGGDATERARAGGRVVVMATVEEALKDIAKEGAGAHVLVTGSLYLVGATLELCGGKPG